MRTSPIWAWRRWCSSSASSRFRRMVLEDTELLRDADSGWPYHTGGLPCVVRRLLLGIVGSIFSTESKFQHHVREDGNVFPEVPWSIITLLANTLAESSSYYLLDWQRDIERWEERRAPYSSGSGENYELGYRGQEYFVLADSVIMNGYVGRSVREEDWKLFRFWTKGWRVIVLLTTGRLINPVW